MPTYVLASVVVRRPDRDYALDRRVTTDADYPALQGASAVLQIIGEPFDSPRWTLTLFDQHAAPFTLPAWTRLQISGQAMRVTVVLDTVMTLIREGDTE